MTGRPGRASDQFPLRLPDGMREQIAEAAKKNGRSMNSEIVTRLRDSLDVDARIAELDPFDDGPEFSESDIDKALHLIEKTLKSRFKRK